MEVGHEITLQALKDVKQILEQTHTGTGYSHAYIAERLLMAVCVADAAIKLAEGAE